jgi:hypothetical protein
MWMQGSSSFGEWNEELTISDEFDERDRLGRITFSFVRSPIATNIEE